MSIIEPGSIVDGRFEVIGEIGHGGMGVVYRARQIGMERDVAVKVLKSDLSGDQEKLQRFRREAQVISLLDHPNIVQIYAVGMTKDGTPYIAMEYLAGQQLSDVIANHGPMPWREAIPLFMQICDALDYAHKMNIVHRDVKPSNIVLERDATTGAISVKLVDFGIAKSLTEQGPALTRTEMVLGSVFYLSPGQIEGRAADPRSDVYALGCTFFEVLTGHPPFIGDTAFDTMNQAVNAPVPSIKEVPRDLDHLIQRMLAKDPEERPEATALVRADLQNILDGVHIENAPVTKTASRLTVARRAKKSNAKRIVRYLSLFLLGGCAIAGTAFFLHKQNSPDEVQQIGEHFTADRFNWYAKTLHQLFGQGKYVEAQIVGEQAAADFDVAMKKHLIINEENLHTFTYFWLMGYYCAGDWQQLLTACKTAERDIRMSPRTPRTNVWLFDPLHYSMQAYNRLGRHAECLKAFDAMESEHILESADVQDQDSALIIAAQSALPLHQYQRASHLLQREGTLLVQERNSLLDLDIEGMKLEIKNAQTRGGISNGELQPYINELNANRADNYSYTSRFVHVARICVAKKCLAEAEKVYNLAVKVAEAPELDDRLTAAYLPDALAHLREWRQYAPKEKWPEIDKHIEKLEARILTARVRANDRSHVHPPVLEKEFF